MTGNIEDTIDEKAKQLDKQAKAEVMNIVNIVEAGPCKKKISVEISEEAIKMAFDQQYRKLNRDTKVPGFNKGRAPRKLLEKRYGKEVNEQVKLKLLADASDLAIKDNGLDMLDKPDIKYEDIKLPENGPMKFEFEMNVRPDSELSLENQLWNTIYELAQDGKEREFVAGASERFFVNYDHTRKVDKTKIIDEFNYIARLFLEETGYKGPNDMFYGHIMRDMLVTDDVDWDNKDEYFKMNFGLLNKDEKDDSKLKKVENALKNNDIITVASIFGTEYGIYILKCSVGVSLDKLKRGSSETRKKVCINWGMGMGILKEDDDYEKKKKVADNIMGGIFNAGKYKYYDKEHPFNLLREFVKISCKYKK